MHTQNMTNRFTHIQIKKQEHILGILEIYKKVNAHKNLYQRVVGRKSKV